MYYLKLYTALVEQLVVMQMKVNLYSPYLNNANKEVWRVAI